MKNLVLPTLVLSAAELNKYVGNELQISGKTAIAGEASGAPSVATKEMVSLIDVSDVNQISSTCKPKPDSQKPAMSRNLPFETKQET
jgi:hypothetical protein